jgi:hypothetical protein
MPTANDIRAAIKARLEAVADIGLVHDYERYAAEQSRFRQLYGAGGRILGWNISRVAARETFVDTGRWSVLTSWRIKGYMSLDDADQSEKLFDARIDAIRDAFRADDELGGAVLTSIRPDNSESGIQVLDQRPVLFAGVLCHHALLGLTTQHLNP